MVTPSSLPPRRLLTDFSVPVNTPVAYLFIDQNK